MIRVLLAVILLSSTAHARIGYLPPVESWASSTGSACRAAHSLTPAGATDYVDDVTLWCTRGPRRSIHIVFFKATDGRLTTAWGGGPYSLPGISNACRGGPHLRHPLRRFHQHGCCEFVLLDATAAGDLSRGEAVVVSFTGFVLCPERTFPSPRRPFPVTTYTRD
jgi:hypothetical protein